jgi:hypothetical protein
LLELASAEAMSKLVEGLEDHERDLEDLVAEGSEDLKTLWILGNEPNVAWTQTCRRRIDLIELADWERSREHRKTETKERERPKEAIEDAVRLHES